MKPGDVYVLNDPYHGGTHLPDVTVVTPVFARPQPTQRAQAAAAARDLFYVASRGITRRSAGSRPARCRRTARAIEEEGVLIDNWLLVEDGRLARGTRRSRC